MKKAKWLGLGLLSVVAFAVMTGCTEAATTVAPQSIVDAFQRPQADNTAVQRVTAVVAVTYYTCEDGFCGSTASGTRVRPGTASCDPDWMGRRFVIHGDPYGLTYKCEDTGGAVHGNHVDIWFATHAEGQALIAAVGTTATIEFR